MLNKTVFVFQIRFFVTELRFTRVRNVINKKYMQVYNFCIWYLIYGASTQVYI